MAGRKVDDRGRDDLAVGGDHHPHPGRARRRGDSIEVQTDSGVWESSHLVIATGHCARAAVPAFAAELAGDIDQLVPTQYRNPQQLRGGAVLVVGASATGIQLASEIARRLRGNDAPATE